MTETKKTTLPAVARAIAAKRWHDNYYDTCGDEVRRAFQSQARAAIAALAATQVDEDAGPPCASCAGRGWNSGECHPRETCGVCLGSGRKHWPTILARCAALEAERDAAVARAEKAEADALRWSKAFAAELADRG